MTAETRFFSEKQVAFSGVLGGPLPAGILFYLNYQRLGKEKEAYISMAVSLGFTFLLFFTLSVIPDEILDKIPNQVFTALYGLIIYFVFKRLLGKQISQKITKENPSASNWGVAGAVVIGLAISLVIITGIAVWQPPFPGNKITFGSGGSSVYYDEEDTSQASVQTLGNILLKDGFFNDLDKSAVRLETSPTELKIVVPIDKEFWTNLEVTGYFGDLKLRLQQEYKKDVTIVLEHYPWSGKTERKFL